MRSIVTRTTRTPYTLIDNDGVLQRVQKTPDVTNTPSAATLLTSARALATNNFKESRRMENAIAANPFALMTDPAAVRQVVERSEQLSKLSQRQCHPLDRAVIRSSSAELAAFDSKIDRTTIYLPPEEDKSSSLTRSYGRSVN
jgi:hypothetical protein